SQRAGSVRSCPPSRGQEQPHMPNIGPGELILILIIAIVFIGPGRLPDVGAALGKSIREFRKASTDMAEATRIDTSPLPPANPAAAASAADPAAAASAADPAPTAAPAPTPEPSVAMPTASTVPAPIAGPPDRAADDEPTNLPA
ncbi:MAG: twin-arginine translocase TatA/TatE family subunit, partial [Candidatus Limnocylindrales bacterium]